MPAFRRTRGLAALTRLCGGTYSREGSNYRNDDDCDPETKHDPSSFPSAHLVLPAVHLFSLPQVRPDCRGLRDQWCATALSPPRCASSASRRRREEPFEPLPPEGSPRGEGQEPELLVPGRRDRGDGSEARASRTSSGLVRAAYLELALLDPQVAGELRLVAAHRLDEALGVLAPRNVSTASPGG
jgi:hypothetical protein